MTITINQFGFFFYDSFNLNFVLLNFKVIDICTDILCADDKYHKYRWFIFNF